MECGVELGVLVLSMDTLGVAMGLQWGCNGAAMVMRMKWIMDGLDAH